MKKEFLAIIIVGLFILAYVLDAAVNPLSLRLASPYHFFTPEIMSLYVFTATSIIIKALALFLSLLWIVSIFELPFIGRGAILLVVSGLMQLYSLQDVATKAHILPLEWSLAFTFCGVILVAPSVFYLTVGFLKQIYTKIVGTDDDPVEYKGSVGKEDSNFWDKK